MNAGMPIDSAARGKARHLIEVVAPQRPARADRATALPYTRRQPAPSPPGRSRCQDARRTTGCISGPPDATGARKPGKWDPSSSGRSWLLIPDRAGLPVARPFCVLDGVDDEPRGLIVAQGGWRRANLGRAHFEQFANDPLSGGSARPGRQHPLRIARPLAGH